VFVFLCLRPVFYVPIVASVYGLSILACLFGLFSCLRPVFYMPIVASVYGLSILSCLFGLFSCLRPVFYMSIVASVYGLSIRYFLVISIPAETPVFLFINHVILRKLQASLLPVWVATPDVNVIYTTSFTVKMERPIKLSKEWCCVPQCKSDGRKRWK
jgi:hypothetical protein